MEEDEEDFSHDFAGVRVRTLFADIDDISKDELTEKIKNTQKAFPLSDAFVRLTSGSLDFGNFHIMFPFDNIDIDILHSVGMSDEATDLIDLHNSEGGFIDDFSGKHPRMKHVFFWVESLQNPASEEQKQQYEAENLFNKEVSNTIMSAIDKKLGKEDEEDAL